MKSILEKLSPEEIKQLSKALNAVQKKAFGNPLSLRKQEQLMADLFEVKDWSTLLGSAPKEVVKEYNSEAPYQKTTIVVEVLSEGAFPTQYSLEDVADMIVNDHYSGVFKEVSREALSAEDMKIALIKQGTDPEFFSLEMEAEADDDLEYEKNKVFHRLMEILYDENEDFYMEAKAEVVAESLLSLFDRERNDAISKYNRLNSDDELSTLSEVERILSEDKLTFSRSDLIKRIKAHG